MSFYHCLRIVLSQTLLLSRYSIASCAMFLTVIFYSQVSIMVVQKQITGNED